MHSTGTYTPYYHTTDHLGSVRVITTPTGTIAEQNDYYPFGERTNLGQQYQQLSTNRYKYNGKEEQTTGSLGYLDYGTRFYDPQIARWLRVDPLAHVRSWVSPYNFVQNNPINRIDPDGRLDDWVESANGKIYWDDNATSQATTKEGEKYLGKNVLVGTHNRDASGNESVNSATFDLYLESNKSGSSATIKGNTVPSDITKYGTLAEGLYSAKFGRRNAEKYKNELAIRIYNLDGTDGLPTLNGNPNKANSDLLTGVLFHSGNPYQESLRDRAGNPVWSHGCQTSGCGSGSKGLHNAFMQKVGTDFNGAYYLRVKPQPVQNSFNFQLPVFTMPVDNTYLAPRVIF
ncbi:MAG: RHS repeat-associated core domain-containing protein [Ignavibacteria bacterium]|nr:RHS repeat-associated core domain-containing protein [Ignavibacteria bacterium]